MTAGRATRRHRARIVAACLLSIVLGEGPALADDSPRQRLEDVQHDIETLRQSIDQNERELSTEKEGLKEVDRRLGKVSRSLRTLKTRIKAVRHRVGELEDQRTEQQKQLTQHRTALRAQVQERYRLGRKGELQFLLDKRGVTPDGRLLVYHEYLSKGLSRELKAVKDTLANLEKTAAEKRLAEQRLARLIDNRKRTQESLTVDEARRKVLVAKLDDSLKDKKTRLEVAKEDERRLTDLVRQLGRSLQPVPERPTGGLFADQKGQLQWPVDGKLVAKFGQRRNREGLRWNGVTIDAAAGSSVLALYTGKVVFADWLRGFGLLVILDHGNGYMSLYGHNQSLYKSVGDEVVQGEEIASVGMSGGLVKPALYFEIRHNGRPENPQGWCRKE